MKYIRFTIFLAVDVATSANEGNMLMIQAAKLNDFPTAEGVTIPSPNVLTRAFVARQPVQ